MENALLTMVLAPLEDRISFTFDSIPPTGVQLIAEVWTSTSPQGKDGTWTKARAARGWGFFPQLPPSDLRIPLLSVPEGNRAIQEEFLDVEMEVRLDGDAFAAAPSAPSMEQAFHVPGVSGSSEASGVPGVSAPPAVLSILKTASGPTVPWDSLVKGKFAATAINSPQHDLVWLLVGASVRS